MPGFHGFLFGRFGENVFEQRPGDHDGAIVVDNDGIVRDHCHPATADGFLPAHKGQTGH